MDMRTQIAKDGSGSSLHPLKTWIDPFRAIINGTKRFEYRKNDRGFKVGDTLKLVEIDPKSEKMTGWYCYVDVTYIAEICFGIPDGYCVMSLSEPLLLFLPLETRTKMSYSLKNQITGEYWNTNNSVWSFITRTLEEHGWEPRGTVIKDLHPGEKWDGTYYSNDGQVVTSEDASAMADACDRITKESLSPDWHKYFQEFAQFCRSGPFELW